MTAIVSKSKTCLIFINQIREKIGVMFGNPETTTGGRALKFYASMRVDIRRIQAIKEGDRVVGSRTRAKVVKNKVAAPFREAEFDILYGEGISREGDLIDLGVDKGVIEKSGTWMSYGGERMGQGRENARVFLKENKDIRDKLENALRKKMEIPFPGQTAVLLRRALMDTQQTVRIRRCSCCKGGGSGCGNVGCESASNAVITTKSLTRDKPGGRAKASPARFIFWEGVVAEKGPERRGGGEVASKVAQGDRTGTARAVRRSK